MTISQSAKDAAMQIGRGCQTMTCVAQTIQKAIDTETSSLRKTLVEAIARRDELERKVQFMVDQGKMP